MRCMARSEGGVGPGLNRDRQRSLLGHSHLQCLCKTLSGSPCVMRLILDSCRGSWSRSHSQTRSQVLFIRRTVAEYLLGARGWELRVPGLSSNGSETLRESRPRPEPQHLHLHSEEFPTLLPAFLLSSPFAWRSGRPLLRGRPACQF